MRSCISRFAPGVIVAVLAVEQHPDIGKELATKEVELGAFAVRSLFMCALKPWTGHPVGHGNQAKGAAVGLLVVTFGDVTADSFIVGAGVAAGREIGTVLVLGLSIERRCLGLAVDSGGIAGWPNVGVTAALRLNVINFAELGSLLVTGADAALLVGAMSICTAALRHPLQDGKAGSCPSRLWFTTL